MHILKIIHGYPPNYNAGSEVYSQSVCNELSKRHKVSIFTREENLYAPDFSIRHEKQSKNLDLYIVNNPQGKDGYRHKQMDDNFAELAKQIQPDIAYIGHLNHLSTGLVDELNKQQIPIVFMLHDYWLMCPRGQFLTRCIGKANNFRVCNGQEDRKCACDCYEVYFSGKETEREQDIAAWSNWVNRRMSETKAIINKVDLFIAPAKYLRNRFIADFGIPENKIIYLDYGFPTEYLTQTEKSKDKTNFTFGYIGTHILAKGVNLLIEAFTKINQPATLKIFGRENGQSTNALKKMAATSANPIEFCGEYVNKNLANTVFANVDCIVVPSIWAENSPLVIHEAQECKVPVVTADYGGMCEYVKHKVNGLLFKHHDVNSLTEQMRWAVEHTAEMQEFGKRGYLYSEDGKVPDIENHCVALIKIFENIVETRCATSLLWRITLDTNPEDCNLHCIMCEEHSLFSDFKQKLFETTGMKFRRMKIEIVERIFEETAKLGIREIIPSTMGEPLLYKDIEKIFELSQKHNIKINLTTNGTFPKKSVEEWAKIIIPNTTDIKISWNGASAETSEKVMTGSNFQKALENTKKLVAFRNAYFEETGYFCRITFQLTFMQNNMHELPDIVKLAAEIGIDRIKGHHLWAHFAEIKTLSMKATKKSVAQWNEYVRQAYEAQEKYRKPNGDKVLLENIVPLTDSEQTEVPENYECPFWERELWISATGKISPCCAPDNLRQSLGDFGNIETTTIQEVLASPIYRGLVANYKSVELCKTCNMRKPLC
jgi:glycosyltransferase involved in cell wall biosynthesis/MoaA/NifB/PqqE/SkfB family radical SAM enzyme